MYEALTGELPIIAQSRRELLDLHQRQIPMPMRQRRPDLDIPDALDQVVMKCLKKRINDRPKSAEELEAMLAAIPLEGLPHELRDAPEAQRAAASDQRGLGDDPGAQQRAAAEAADGVSASAKDPHETGEDSRR